MPSIGLG